MNRLVSRILARFRGNMNSEDDKEQHQGLLEGTQFIPVFKDESKVKTVHGVVTTYWHHYGWMNEHIFFSADAVTGGVPLQVGQQVTAVIEEDKILPGLKAFKVDPVISSHENEQSESYKSVSLSHISSLMDGTDSVKDETPFTLDIVCKDFEPYKGDLVEVKFSPQSDAQTRKAISVKPLKHMHVNKVYITSMEGRDGVVDSNIFFTLDSLKLPSGYIPQPGDRVDVVTVQSTHFRYYWRAISMTPV